MSTMAVGRWGEDVAAAFLAGRGFEILARNWRCKGLGLTGEVDILARRGQVLVVCEVKTRSSDRFGTALEAVSVGQARRLRRLAATWLLSPEGRAAGPVGEVRFDVVTVAPPAWRPTVQHHEGVL